MTNPSAKLIEELIEAARLLGTTQAKRGFGVYTQEDAMIEQAFHESIDKKTRTLCAELARSIGKFKIGDHVRKIKGSQWKGRIVGWYSTALTPVGWAVESDTEVGSVQIYPESALELWVDNS